MRFKRLELSGLYDLRGLPEQTMEGLARVVFLVGPNGCGKSRLLSYVKQIVTLDLQFDKKELEVRHDGVTRSVALHQSTLAHEENQARMANSPHASGVERARRRLEKELKRLASMDAQVRRLNNDYDVPPDVGNAGFLLAGRALGMPNDRAATQLPIEGRDDLIADLAKMLGKVSFSDPERVHFIEPFLNLMADVRYQSMNPHARSEVISRWIPVFGNVAKMVFQLMDKEFGYHVGLTNAVASLAGRPINRQELSDGQRQVLGIAAGVVAATNGKLGSLEGNIVLVDEPEVHLHPNVSGQLLEEIIRAVGPTGQVWVATHSVSLISRFPDAQIWTMKDGLVSPPGADVTTRALSALVGNEQAVELLGSFVSGPDKAAAARLVAECLLPPAVAEHRDGDPQLVQITSSIPLQPSRTSIRVLDCGAGKGRLALALAASKADSGAKIEYLAVEPNAELHGTVAAAANDMLLGGQVYAAVNALPSQYDETCDFVVMCNVLHEVRATKWASLLAGIKKRLKPDGKLIICEDQEMPHGERPNDLGFLILGRSELCTLLGNSSPSETPSREAKYADRLLCLSFDCQTIACTSESVAAAVTDLQRRVRADLESLRSSETINARDARRYALLSQLFINCDSALSELGRN